MDLARIKPTPGAIYQVLVEPDTAAEDVAVELAEYLSTEAIIGTDASAQISFLRETCIEEVVLGLENAGVPAPEMQRRGERMLRAVGLSDYCEHDPTQLSGGQTRRLATAIIASQPRNRRFRDRDFYRSDAEGRAGGLRKVPPFLLCCTPACR